MSAPATAASLRRSEITERAAEAQRRAAVPEATVWVAASAGTGKTKVLIDRVLSLLIEGSAPERILCLTFTKAAAAEMANRLAERLKRWVAEDEADVKTQLEALTGEPPDDERIARARGLFARVLDAPGGIKIQTIHAFCQSLLGRFPLEAGVAPNFHVLDERSAAEMLAAAREEALAAARPAGDQEFAEAVRVITTHARDESFVELVRRLVGERGRFGRLLREHGGIEGVTAALGDALGVDPSDSEETLLQAAVRDEALDVAGLRRVAVAMLEAGTTARQRGALITAWLAEPDRRVAAFETYLRAFFGEAGRGERFSRLVFKPVLEREPDAEAVLTREADRLEALRARLRGLAVLRATRALITVGERVLSIYEGHKRTRGLLDYDDLILETRALLTGEGAAAWVLFKLDGGLDHLLVDEAQDTNPEQWQVIEALTAEFYAGEGARDRPRTVFAVGDAKQSIYSFQRAEPEKFAQMRDYFRARAEAARLHWDRIDLAVCFRSTAPVLEAVDRVFAEAPASDGLLLDDAVLHHLPVRVGQAGRVEVWPPARPAEREAPDSWSPPLVREAEEPPLRRLARLIAQRIWRWTLAPDGADDPDSWLDSKGRRMRPGDLLVLVRRRNAFVDELVRALKERDVPVAGVDRMVLSDQLAVMDLIALGRTLLLPEDELTLATVLKGPLFELAEERLFDLAWGRSGSLWQALQARAGEAGDFADCFARLAALRSQVDYLRPYELYARLLGPAGGRARLLARLGAEAGDPIDEFLSLALAYERDHLPSLEGFLHWLTSASQEVKRDMEHGQDAVRVMTVHGAKGLQAPVVFLPDTCQVPRHVPSLLWLGAEDLLLWPLGKGYAVPASEAARQQGRRKAAEEYRRLLYVAMTRAEDRLYVCGWTGRKAPPADNWYELVERALAPAAESFECDFSAEIAGGWSGPGLRLVGPQEDEPEDEEPRRAPGEAGPLEPWALGAAPAEPVPPRPLAPSRPADEEPPPRSPLGGDRGRRFRRGLIIHRLLQLLPELTPEARAGAAERFLERPVHGLEPAARDEIREVVLAVLNDPESAFLFGPGSRAEVPLVGRVAGRGGVEVVSAQVDRLLVEPGRLAILDYKSQRPAPAREQDVAAPYLRQMALYGTLLREIYPDRSVTCYLLWTDGPALMQLSDEILAEHAP